MSYVFLILIPRFLSNYTIDPVSSPQIFQALISSLLFGLIQPTHCALSQCFSEWGLPESQLPEAGICTFNKNLPGASQKDQVPLGPIDSNFLTVHHMTLCEPLTYSVCVYLFLVFKSFHIAAHNQRLTFYFRK